MITKITEPQGNINLYTDYAFEYNSDIYDLINFKYKIEFIEEKNTLQTFYNGYFGNGAYFGTSGSTNLISSNVFSGFTAQAGDTIKIFNAQPGNGTYTLLTQTSPTVVLVSSGTTLFSGFTAPNPYFIIKGYRDLYTTIDTFERFPQPDTNVRFDLRKYISSGIESDYFEDNYSKVDGLYDNPLDRKFKLKVSEEYAYQFPFGIIDAFGIETGTGVSASTTKYYNIYDLKLTYDNNGSTETPSFEVGSVVEIIDNGPTPNINSINGIYTILEVGIGYVVVNGIYDSTKTYYSGSILWSDRRQITNIGTTYTSNLFTSLNSCSETNKSIYTSLPTGYDLRCNSVLLLPLIDYNGVTITNNGSTVFSSISTGNTSNLLKYIIPCTASTVSISTTGLSGSSDTRSFNIIEKCEDKFKKTTLYFLDRKGAFIPFYFDLLNTKMVDITNQNWKGLNNDNRGVKYQIGTQVSEKYKITSDWLKNNENDIFQELIESSYIWMDFENTGVMKKVLIVDKSFEIKSTNKDKLFNYMITVELAKEKFVQNY